MAKKKASGGLEAGTRVRVREQVTSPEFPDVSLAGWTGTIAEVTGKPPALKLIIEWDTATMGRLPADYVSRCEAQQLYYAMACLGSEDVDLVA